MRIDISDNRELILSIVNLRWGLRSKSPTEISCCLKVLALLWFYEVLKIMLPTVKASSSTFQGGFRSRKENTNPPWKGGRDFED